jgi:hypothetical protein
MSGALDPVWIGPRVPTEWRAIRITEQPLFSNRPDHILTIMIQWVKSCVITNKEELRKAVEIAINRKVEEYF